MIQSANFVIDFFYLAEQTETSISKNICISDTSTTKLRNYQQDIITDIYIYIYIYLGSKRSFMHVLLKKMAHSLFIIFLRVFSYFLISFILLW